MQHAIFALELCLKLEASSTLRSQVHDLLRRHPAAATPGEKWQFYEILRRLLRTNVRSAVSGCWDFFDSNQKALDDFNMWSNGMITREGARKEPSGTPDPYRGNEARYMTVTMAFLMVNGEPSVNSLAFSCNIPKPHLWKRKTFVTILDALGSLSFASVKGDVAYLIPGDQEWGLTDEDMRHKKFEYLRPLSD